MEVERRLGCFPRDFESDKLGYDIESRDPRTGRLRFNEVKGRDADGATQYRHQKRDPHRPEQADSFISRW
jgi:hypothetical protein